MLPSLLLAVVALAQPTEPPVETLIKLTVDATPAPKPALKYLLLPELSEQAPGNPIPNYMKAVLDQESSGADAPGKLSLQQADRAARMDKPDWQILDRLKADGISLLLPDLQKMRQLASGLQIRFRDEIGQRRFDDAIVTAKTMFALSRHMGEHPTLIGGLVAIAIAQVAIAPLEEMLDQPGCPNLYWALTALPAPFVALDRGMEGERIFITAEFRDLDSKNPMTTAQLKALIKRLDLLLEVGRNEKRTLEWLADHARDDAYMTAGRARLVETGIPAERLATFSPYQVILLNERIEYEIQRDEAMKFSPLPTWEAVPRMDALAKKERGLFRGFLPALQKVRRAQGRLEQRIALLRHVEAIRMYAAAHEGKVPPKLSDVDIPLPLDPFTGKPFRYEVIDGVAHLRGNPPKGDDKNVAYNLHYEIVIRK